MKKILFFAICLLVAGSVNAQRRYYHSPRGGSYANNSNDDDFYQPKIGLEIGGNIANQISSNYDNYSSGTVGGINAGLTFDLPIVYPFSFAPEVLYSQKGYQARTADGNFTQRTNFIDIPLLAKFKVGPAFNFLIGPQLSYLLSTTNTYDNGFDVTQEENYENRSGHKSYLDGVLGVSFDLNRWVDLHARYTVDLDKTDSYGNTYVPDYRNQVWQIGIGFRLN
ncbi:porin family protein [Mucilaginibacter sp. dw_454]|uniref:porin family protein n=1 Tax=Mucilaginibacter sp. dw_454 TaxID=2720079 RepID=UPI001BD5017E|nr:porin family protein [Mucilaginibacter sp. dw_454]